MLKNLLFKSGSSDSTNLAQFSKLLASDGAANDRFGYSVSISGDGETVVIGAYFDDDKGTDSGSAYVFTSQGNGQYTQTQKLSASDGAANDYFGWSVSISGDGGSIVIGTYFDDDKGTDSGSAYIFTRQENGQYTQTQKILANDGVTYDYFGYSVSISGDGGTVVIGAYGDDDKGSSSGSAYIFTRQTNGQYTQTQKLLASDGAKYDNFGRTVSISNDGGSIVIGLFNTGYWYSASYVFTRQENGQYTQTQKLLQSDGAGSDRFGYSVSISGDGGTIVIGAYFDDDKGTDSGSAYVFTSQGNGQYVETQKLLPSDGSYMGYFGISVSISGDGGTIVMGSNKNAAYVSTKQEDGQYTQTQKLVASDGAAGGGFGNSVSISGDGGSIVIGAYNDDGAKGAAYIFK